VRRDLWFALGLWTVAALVGGFAFPQLLAPIASAWTLIVLGRLMFELEDAAYGLTRRSSAFDEALRVRAPEPVRPPDLVRLEGAFGWGTYEPREFDHHVRPVLQRLIEHRARKRGPGEELPPEIRSLAGSIRAEEIFDRRIETADLDRISRGIDGL
jgi:hypothetical protein